MTKASPSPEDGADFGLQPALVRAWALEAGFAEAGVLALPYGDTARDAERFEGWVAAGRAGTMGYLERRGEDAKLLRARVGTPFPWARSAVVCFTGYQGRQPLSTEPADAGAGWIARYAWSSRVDAEGWRRPSDYHKVLKRRLDALEARIRGEVPGAFEVRGFVDTGPVVERSLAVAAGLGWTGKNTCLIHPKLGSFGFLAVLLTSLPVQRETVPAALHPDRCGTCRRCIEVCPTNALIEPYKMDATRCISYLTIEHKGAIAEELMQGMGRQVFGCDICQDVCPWNRKAPIGVDNEQLDSPSRVTSKDELIPDRLLSQPAPVPHPCDSLSSHGWDSTKPNRTVPQELEPRAELVNPALEWLGSLDEQSFEQQFNGSPVRRAGFNGLRRNVAIAMGNSGLQKFAPFLAAWTDAADEGLRTAARWALKNLQAASAAQQ